MGLFGAFQNAAKGVLADQWKEFFLCERMEDEILLMEGSAKISEKSANQKRNRDVITDGSIVVVQEGQYALAVENGQILQTFLEPGEHIFHSEKSKTIFEGERILEMTDEMGKRTTFGGDISDYTQRIYYINGRELGGFHLNSMDALPLRVTDDNIGLDMDCNLRLDGMFSFKIVDPVIFYQNVTGNARMYRASTLLSTLRTEVIGRIQPKLASLSFEGIHMSQISALLPELGNGLIEEVNEYLVPLRGIALWSLAFGECRLLKSDMTMIQQLQHDAVFRDPRAKANDILKNQIKEHQTRKNPETDKVLTETIQKGEHPAFDRYLGKQNRGLDNIQPKSQINQPKSMLYYNGSWKCECGQENGSAFCENCGKKRPESD